MKSTESMGTRLQMVEMQEFFIQRIDEAISEGRDIEATWLVYACLENRYYRTLLKFKKQCKYCTSKSKCGKKKNELALQTKIRCIQRLSISGARGIAESFQPALLDETLQWVKNRNTLTHALLTLDSYEDCYTHSFHDSAMKGNSILLRTYESCTSFRKIFYSDNFIFNFPESCMNKCQCAKKQKESE